MKKILTILLCFVLLTGCFSLRNNIKYTKDPSEYINAIKNFEVREKNLNNINDNKEFNEYLDKVFVTGLSFDFLTMHFSVVDYKKYGIEKPEVNLGKIEYGFDNELFEYYENQLSELKEFDYNSLSYSQQYDYDALEYSFYETLASLCFYMHDYVFSSRTCTPETILSNLSDYTFYDQESVDDYITCLKDTERYMDAALQYTDAQTKEGYYTLDESLDYTKKCCDEFTSKIDDNSLIISFNNRINEIDFISEEEKNEYIKENEKIVKEIVIPSYQKVSSELDKYYGKADTSKRALCNVDKKYAEFVYLLETSNNDDIDDTFEQLKEVLVKFEEEYIDVYHNEEMAKLKDSAVNGEIEAFLLVDTEALEFLMENARSCYPDIGDIKYDAQRLDPTTAPASAIAYYWPAPVDNSDQNIIRINPNNMEAGTNTYSTLAHEGFPGHLFQHVYYLKTNPHNFRSIISFTGYAEGYAIQASQDAFNFSGINNTLVADSLFFDENYYFILYSIVDIGVNYYGWNSKDMVEFFDENSRLFDFTNDAEEYRNFIIDNYTTYCTYGVGYTKLYNLRKDAMNELGTSFNLIDYNEAILKNGPLPFNILKEAVNEYIDSVK